MLGLPVNNAIPETINGPKNPEDLPINYKNQKTQLLYLAELNY